MNAFNAEWEWGWNTPLLLQPTFSPLSPAISEFLAVPLARMDLEKAGLELEQHFSELKTSRIGVRFERIEEALFRANPHTSSLRCGIVIPGRTEIDILHQLHSLPRTWIHWEVALKFYLAIDDEGSENADRWIGPNLKDTLGLKLRTIFERQLSVLRDPAIREQVGIPADDTVLTSPFVKGILFLPWRWLARERARPPEVHPEGQRGYWVEESELEEFAAALKHRAPEGKLLYFLDRRDWLRTHVPEEKTESDLKVFFNSTLARPTQADQAGNLKFQPFQGSFVTLKHSSDGANEIRFFCVPDGWRESAERALESLCQMSRIKA